MLNVGRTTNSLGVASADFSLNVRGEYTAKAEFQESGDYFGSHNITTLVVNPIATNLTLEPVGETLLSEQLDLSARLLDQYENPIHEATVEFYLHNGSAWTLLGSSATDQNGVAALSYVPAVIGNFTLKAAFNGTAKHASSASHERVLTVVTPPTDYGSIIIPLVVIALAIALAFIVLKRRKPQ
jgi:5-hydroxyisourate hydrolase-like protein (transthyretin family)